MSIPTAILKIGESAESLQPIPSSAVITQLDVVREVGKISLAEVTLVDGNPAIRNFRLSDGPDFKPGHFLEIILRYEGVPESETTVFKGIIVQHSIEATVRGGMLKVTAKDQAVNMTTLRKQAIHVDLTDNTLFAELINANGLEVGRLAETTPEYPEIVQFWCSDWDMLLSRADYQGFWVLTQDGTVEVLNPEEIDLATAQHTYEYGMDELYGFRINLDAQAQYGAITATGWNLSNQALESGTEANRYNPNPGEVDPSDLASKVGGDSLTVNSTVPVPTEELTNWAQGQLRKSRDHMVRGYLSIRGNPSLLIGEVVELKGLSVNFNGKVPISGIRHRLSAGGWVTDIQFGRSPSASYANKREVPQPLAGGLIPPVQGLQIGKVDAIELDPTDQLRVKIKLAAMGEEAESIWARLASPEAGDQRGYLFRPEEGDEVVVAFVNNDPRYPVILGSLYSDAIATPVPSEEITEENFIKGIYTKSGLKVSFDDEKKALTLQTEEKRFITLNETDKTIEIKDKDDHYLLFNDKGLTIKCSGDLTLEATGKVVIKGSEVDVQ